MSRQKFLTAAARAAALCCLGGSCLAQGAPTIYGRLSTGLEYVDAGDDRASLNRLAAYRSVIGFRGREDLGAELYAQYQIEGAVSLDTGVGGMTNRDTGVALGHERYGLLRLGHWLTPYTQVSARLDPYYATSAGFSSFIGNGATPTSGHFGNTAAFDRRQADQLQWVFTGVPDWTLSLAHAFSETTLAASNRKPSLWSAAAERRANEGTQLIALEQHRNYQAQGRSDLGIKLGLSQEIGPWRATVIAERLKYETATGELRRLAYFVSVSRAVGAAGRVAFSLAQAQDGKGDAREQLGFVFSGADSGARQLTLAYDHRLSPRTQLFVLASRLHNDGNGRYDFSLNPVNPSAGQSIKLIALGIRTSF